MSAVRRDVPALALYALLAGCMQLTVNSQRDTHDDLSVQRVFVFSVVGGLRESPQEEFATFAQAFQNRITSSLAARGVAAEAVTVGRNDLKTAARSPKFKTFSPDFVLVVAPVRRVLRVGSIYLFHPDTLTFDASLYDRSSNIRCWNAQITIDRPMFSRGWGSREADALAAAVVDELGKDGLVTSVRAPFPAIGGAQRSQTTYSSRSVPSTYTA